MTPNRFNGRDSAPWWDDLPPRIRARFTLATDLRHEESVASSPPEGSLFVRLASRFGVLLLFIALTNVVLILLVSLIILGAKIGFSPANP